MNSRFTNTVSRRTFLQCGAGAALTTISDSRITQADRPTEIRVRTAPGETFVIDAGGRIAYKHIGVLTEQALAGTIQPLVDKLRLQAGGAKP